MAQIVSDVAIKGRGVNLKMYFSSKMLINSPLEVRLIEKKTKLYLRNIFIHGFIFDKNKI